MTNYGSILHIIANSTQLCKNAYEMATWILREYDAHEWRTLHNMASNGPVRPVLVKDNYGQELQVWMS